ncbi:hypothetical protein BDR07DRAFT_367555 [Suillus spraguei]|nr:hypothetical protein BDR07DRAFT_367555 [Suillus spraguei]
MAADISLASSLAQTRSLTLLVPVTGTSITYASSRHFAPAPVLRSKNSFVPSLMPTLPGALSNPSRENRTIAQILLIQQALAIRYRRSERLSTTSTEISDMVRSIYAIGIPKEDNFITIIMLNVMNEELTHVRNHIADALSTSTSTSTYGPTNIWSRLDMEQQLLDSDKKGSGDVALVTSSKGNRSREARPGKTCSECGVAGHTSCCTTCKN